MVGVQVSHGKAYEHAVASSIASLIACPIVESKAASLARECFLGLRQELQLKFRRTANKAAEIIVRQENWLHDAVNKYVSLQQDSSGEVGDVRDVLIYSQERVLGISCKTNHNALKHCRLSRQIDFIQKWQIDPQGGCSETYWRAIRPLFDELDAIRLASNGTALWSAEADVPRRFYWPILDAWEIELRRALKGASSEGQACAALVRYLFGAQDYYKVIGSHRTNLSVNVKGFNFDGTLSGKKAKLPKKLIGVDNENGSKYSKTVRFNGGFSLNFRIHNASSRVEPSLKFDVTALSLPPEQFTEFDEPIR
jgi:hypothetical protein